MATSSNTVITTAARSKMAKARAGDITLPTIEGMVFGNKGVDSNGNVIEPDEDATGLTNEIYRKEIASHKDGSSTSIIYTCVLEEDELPNSSISEIGFYDSDGDVLCVKHFLAKGKDENSTQTYELEDVF